jgi:hypothetical protein
MKSKKTWNEKLHDSKGLPKVEKLKGKLAKKWGAETLAIPAPIEVDEIMRKVPKGKIITINKIREKIAIKHNADIGCPITTGIFAWIAAHAAEEDRMSGKKRITPWWRTLKTDGELNEKYPGSIENQMTLLKKEGFSFKPKGKRLLVQDYEKFLIK